MQLPDKAAAPYRLGMSNAPETHIDLATFAADPYPALEQMRDKAPITYVPQLGATLITRRDDIFVQEKRIEVLSSDQPDGLLTQVMGPNMMRKDGAAHMAERKALFPALSPRTVRDHLEDKFAQIVQNHLDRLRPRGQMDLVTDFAMPVSADALRTMTGLTNMSAIDMDTASQAMLDAAANYQKDPQIDAKGYAWKDHIKELIAQRLPQLRKSPDLSIISVFDQAGLDLDAIAGNVRVIIGGGQNEPRDAIAGCAWALMTHPDQHALILNGRRSYADAFAEYVRLIAPIGMSPRRVARQDSAAGVTLHEGDLVFLMFGSAGRDRAHFDSPDAFDITRDTQPAIPFGAGPHFCAGAAASRTLIASHALPKLFAALPNLHITGDVPFHGWAFRGPTTLPVVWDA